jgi:hypothetical protein
MVLIAANEDINAYQNPKNHKERIRLMLSQYIKKEFEVRR